MSYWANRQEEELNRITNKTEKEINKQLDKYYAKAMKQAIKDFEDTYNALMAQITAGEQVTVAKLYALDRYWQLQGSLRRLCEELGNKEIALLSKNFEKEWQEVYDAAALPSDDAFTFVSESNAEQAIKSTWLADGKTFSDRVWQSSEDLVASLNEDFVHLVITGGDTRNVTNRLEQMVADNVQNKRAKARTLVNTEINHIQTEAAAKRYKDSGLDEYMFLGRENHERELKCACKELDGKVFSFAEKVVGKNCPPMHPNCRCRIKPIMKDDILRKAQEENRQKEQEKRAIKAEADELRKQAKQLRAEAKALKAEGKTQQANLMIREAVALEKRYRELYAKLNSL
jgi:SPP1 gp7 family putative phage head morphogenesis protein